MRLFGLIFVIFWHSLAFSDLSNQIKKENKVNEQLKIEQLIRGSKADREKAVDKVIKLGGEEGEKLLDVLMKDPSSQVRRRIAFKLVDWESGQPTIASTVKRFKILSQDSDPEVREAVAENIGRLKDPASVVILNKMLETETGPSVRRGIVAGAINLGGEQREKLLDVLMKDPISRVRIGVAFELVNWMSERSAIASAVDRFKTLSQDSDPLVRESVAENIGRLKDPVSVVILNEMVETETDPEVRIGIIAGAINLGGKRGEKLLDVLMKDPDPEVRIGVAFELVSWMSERSAIASAVDRFKILSQDSDPLVRESVAENIGKLKDPASVVILNEMVETETDPEVRRGIVEGAINLGGKRGEKLLGVLMKDPNPQVRIGVAFKLVNWISGQPTIASTVKRFKSLSQDSDPQVREAVAKNIGKLKDPASVVILNKMVKTEIDPEVQRAIKEALIKMGITVQQKGVLTAIKRALNIQTKKESSSCQKAF